MALVTVGEAQTLPSPITWAVQQTAGVRAPYVPGANKQQYLRSGPPGEPVSVSATASPLATTPVWDLAGWFRKKLRPMSHNRDPKMFCISSDLQQAILMVSVSVSIDSLKKYFIW